MRNNPLTENPTPIDPTRYSRDRWQVVRCRETGMVYLANPPDYERLEEDFAWEKTYAEEKRRRRQKEPVFSALSDFIKTLRRTLRPRERIETLSVSLLRRQSQRRGSEMLQVIDVGCGIGDKAVAIARRLRDNHQITVRPVGIEISAAQARTADGHLQPFGGHCLQASALEGMQTVADDSADLIILCSFLEHEVQPLPLLRACRRALSPDGVIIIKVPNFGSLNRRLRQDRWCGFRYPDHVNYFTPRTLRAAIERSGLRVARMNFFDRLPTSDNMWALARKPL